MERPVLFAHLERHGKVFHTLLAGLSAAEISWKLAPDKWCPLELICHLHDEEREDFRARLGSTLEDPGRPWPAIDPAAWVGERRYMEQDFTRTLRGFLEERQHSLEWLRGQDHAPWTNAYIHPKVGPVSCDLLLTNWVAHDLHHIRQLIDLRYAYLQAHSTVPLDYAGNW